MAHEVVVGYTVLKRKGPERDAAVVSLMDRVQQAGWTRKALAKELKVSYFTVARWFTGYHKPHQHLLARLQELARG